MNTFETILIIIALIIAIPLIIIGAIKYENKFVEDEIKKGTEDKLKGKEYEFKWTNYPNPKTAFFTYERIKKGIDKNVNELNNQNSQEPK